MFFTIGEWEYKNNGTFILGTAEGGRKILLSGINYLDQYIENDQMLNHYYFKTIHHEFTHILNKTKAIPTENQLVTVNGYVADIGVKNPIMNSIYLVDSSLAMRSILTKKILLK